jgi:hypothetical protein
MMLGEDLKEADLRFRPNESKDDEERSQEAVEFHWAGGCPVERNPSPSEEGAR